MGEGREESRKETLGIKFWDLFDIFIFLMAIRTSVEILHFDTKWAISFIKVDGPLIRSNHCSIS